MLVSTVFYVSPKWGPLQNYGKVFLFHLFFILLFWFLSFQSIYVMSKHFSNFKKNIKQVSCIEVPNSTVLGKLYFAYLVYVKI